MTDIIERLKYFSGWSAREVPGVELSPVSALCWDAIDEIERLRNPAQQTRMATAIAAVLHHNDKHGSSIPVPIIEMLREASSLPSTGLPAPAPHAEVREALEAAYDTLVFYANMDSYNNGAAERIANTADGVPAYKITPAPIMLDDGQKARSLLSAIRTALALKENVGGSDAG